MFARLIAFVRALLGVPGPWRFADLEVFGHRRHFGKVREIGWLGARFIEVQDLERDAPAATIRYGAGAIFSCCWLTEEEGQVRIRGIERRKLTDAEDRKRWQEEAKTRKALEQREADLREMVTNALDAGPRAREQILERLVSAGLSPIEAERATYDCIVGGEIVEDPQGSGTYRLPTREEESDGIPF